MPWMAAAAVAAPIITGAMGQAASSGDRQNATAMQQAALNNILALKTPDIADMRAILSQYQNAGQLNPEMTDTYSQDPSLMGKVSTDPRLKNAQMQALAQMQKIGQGGLRPQDVAMLAQIRNQGTQAEHSNEEAILQNMQQRGIGGSGAELAAKLSSAQNSANSANMQSLNVGAQAHQAALQALMNSGQLGGSMQAQEFGQQAAQAQAQDAINRYNSQNQQQIAGQNTYYRNSAQSQNLANKQNIMNMNTGIANQQTMYNASLPQLSYQNQLGKASAAAGQYQGMANMYNNQAANTQTTFAGMGQGASKAATAIYGYNSKPNSGGGGGGGGGGRVDQNSGMPGSDPSDYTSLP